MLISIPVRHGRKLPDGRRETHPMLFNSFVAEELNMVMLGTTLAMSPWERIQSNDEARNLTRMVQEPCYCNHLLKTVEFMDFEPLPE